MENTKPPNELERLREALRHVREDREQVASGLIETTGWMRNRHLQRLSELDAVIEKLQQLIAQGG